MLEIARLLFLAAQAEARKRGRLAAPANDNDPPEPPPAAASRLPCYPIQTKGRACNTMISRF
jgi:hypothetical protein